MPVTKTIEFQVSNRVLSSSLQSSSTQSVVLTHIR